MRRVKSIQELKSIESFDSTPKSLLLEYQRVIKELHLIKGDVKSLRQTIYVKK
jgi:hypothetical protein